MVVLHYTEFQVQHTSSLVHIHCKMITTVSLVTSSINIVPVTTILLISLHMLYILHHLLISFSYLVNASYVYHLLIISLSFLSGNHICLSVFI